MNEPIVFNATAHAAGAKAAAEVSRQLAGYMYTVKASKYVMVDEALGEAKPSTADSRKRLAKRGAVLVADTSAYTLDGFSKMLLDSIKREMDDQAPMMLVLFTEGGYELEASNAKAEAMHSGYVVEAVAACKKGSGKSGGKGPSKKSLDAAVRTFVQQLEAYSSYSPEWPEEPVAEDGM